MASTYLTRTFGSAGNQQIFTFSAWVKFSDDDNLNYIFSTGADAENRLVLLRHNSATGSTLKVDGKTATTQTIEVRTNRAFRDTSAWYHLVLSVDTTQATSSDRVKIYVNGVQETSFAQSTYPSQNYNTEVNKAAIHYVGKTNSGSTYYNGSMSHVHFIDGTAYDASAFGETDANGVWKAKTSPSVTYGNNGFFILKDSGSVTDQSGNGNNFTVSGGTLTDTLDCPANVFATLNPLDNYYYNSTFSNGNTTQTCNSSNYSFNTSTLGASSGKYYVEVKASDSGTARNVVGITDRVSTGAQNELSSVANGWSYTPNGQIYNNGSLLDTYSTWSTNDIISIGLDLDNNKVYFGVNGTWQNSADPSAGTGGLSITDPASTLNGIYFIAGGDYGASDNSVNQFNFGNGYFATTPVASAGTNASGNGIFEYDVPTGYTALCTKGLNGE